jgi:hypothetical protein
MSLNRSDMNLGQILEAMANQTARNTAGIIPGRIVTYSSVSRTASVKPAVNRLVPNFEQFEEEVSEELPVLQDVPVVWWQARGVKIEGSLMPGDPVLLLAMDRDISAWRRSGNVVDPDDSRQKSWAHCVALVGLVPDVNPLPTPTDAAALASKVDPVLSALKFIPTSPPPGSPAITMDNFLLYLNAIYTAALAALPTPVSSTASQRLKVDS